MTFEDAIKLKTGDIIYTDQPLEFEFGELPKFAKLKVTQPYSERAGRRRPWLTAIVVGPIHQGAECEFDKLDAVFFRFDPSEVFPHGQFFCTQQAFYAQVSSTSTVKTDTKYVTLNKGTHLVVATPLSEQPGFGERVMTATVADEKSSYNGVEVIFAETHLSRMEPLPTHDCPCCDGDEPVFAMGDNSVFVSSQGNMLVTLNGSEMSLKVKFCPVCGKPLGQQPRIGERGEPT